MSLTQEPHDIAGSPSQNIFLHAADGNQRSSMQLPPMSSLLPRHEQHVRTEGNPQYLSTQLPDVHHPLHISEMNPFAPVNHASHSPHVSGYHQVPSLLVPSEPAMSSSVFDHGALIQAQGRQSRKISQRRTDPPKERACINRSSGSLEECHDESISRASSHGQDTSLYTQRVVKPSSRSRSPGLSPRQSHRSVMPISGLLTATEREQPPQGTSPRYSLTLCQQPMSARACGFGDRDRRVIDPPPILILNIDRPPEIPMTYTVHCTLCYSPTGEDAMPMPLLTDRRQNRNLLGNLVASPFYGKDENNDKKCFFTFPDLSVRTAATYTLKFRLIPMNPMAPHERLPVVATVDSEPFEVFTAKDFGGMRPSTELTRCLNAQGHPIPVKKGNQRVNALPGRGRHEGDGRDEEEGVDDDEDDAAAGDNRMGRAPKRPRIDD